MVLLPFAPRFQLQAAATRAWRRCVAAGLAQGGVAARGQRDKDVHGVDDLQQRNVVNMCANIWMTGGVRLQG